MVPSPAQPSCRFWHLRTNSVPALQPPAPSLVSAVGNPWLKGTNTSGICSAFTFHGSLKPQEWQCSTSGVLHQRLSGFFPYWNYSTEVFLLAISAGEDPSPSMVQPVILQSEWAKIPLWSGAQWSLCWPKEPSLTKASPPSHSLKAFLSPLWMYFPYIGSTGVANIFHNSFLVMVAQRRVECSAHWTIIPV